MDSTNRIIQIEALKERTQALALRVIKLFQALPKTDEASIIGKAITPLSYFRGC